MKNMEKIEAVIAEINQFRQTKEFKDKIQLIQKQLWISEQMDYWFDTETHTESVSEYQDDKEWPVYMLQILILDQAITLLGKFCDHPEYRWYHVSKEKTKHYSDLKRQMRAQVDELITLNDPHFERC